MDYLIRGKLIDEETELSKHFFFAGVKNTLMNQIGDNIIVSAYVSYSNIIQTMLLKLLNHVTTYGNAIVFLIIVLV